MVANGAARKRRQVRLERQMLERVIDTNRSSDEMVKLLETDRTKLIVD